MRLVDDLFDVSRIARGKVELRRRRVDIRDVIANAIEIAESPLLEHRLHHLEVDAPQRLPRRRRRCGSGHLTQTQVFTNLLTNAWRRYTEPGGRDFVIVRVSGDDVVVEVRDDGIGIDGELLPRIFEIFVQGNQQVDRARGGLGLGLSLVRSLVHLHGGEVEVRSEGLGLGSSFTIRLPAVNQPAASEPAGPLANAFPSTAGKQRILLVDDNEDACMLLSDILAAVGHEVRTAADGVAALDVIKEFTPDVAILDIGLPIMDGYELAARLLEIMKGSPPRLISLTGYGQQADLDRSMSAGFDRHLVKPVDVQKLLATIADLVR